MPCCFLPSLLHSRSDLRGSLTILQLSSAPSPFSLTGLSSNKCLLHVLVSASQSTTTNTVHSGAVSQWEVSSASLFSLLTLVRMCRGGEARLAGRGGQVSHLSKKNCPRVQKASKSLSEDLRLLQSGRQTELNTKYNRDKWGFLANGWVRNWTENYQEELG